MRKLMTFLVTCTLTSGIAFASPIYKAECPISVMVEHEALWQAWAKQAGFNDHVDKVMVGCFVVSPPISFEEFKTCPLVHQTNAAFPEVVFPWTINREVLHYIGARAVGPKKFEFIEYIYSAKTGKLVLVRAFVSRL